MGAMLAMLLALLSAWAPAGSQSGLPREVVLLARVKQKTLSTLERLPDYTCRLDLEQARRRRLETDFRLIDRLQLEVANVAGEEVYSKPGGKEFQDATPGQLGSAGASLTGDFALHLRAIFLGSGSVIRYAGPDQLEGRKLERFRFEVSEVSNPITLVHQGAAVDLASRGSFWADPESFEIVRLELWLDKIPEYVQLESGVTRVDYADIPVAGKPMRLPQRSESFVTDRKGNALRTRTRYSECRQYTGLSSLSFGDPAEPAPAAKPK